VRPACAFQTCALRRAVATLALACMAGLGTSSFAQEGYLALNAPPQPDDCVTQAAQYHGVNSWILRAIIQVESNFNAAAVNRNQNGTTDHGIAQINSMHFRELSRHGVTPGDLMDGCKASYVAAWHLGKQIRAYGNTWYAVGAYHSTTPCFNRRYTAMVWNAMHKWGVVQGQRAVVPSMASCGVTKTASKSGRSESSPAAVLNN